MKPFIRNCLFCAAAVLCFAAKPAAASPGYLAYPLAAGINAEYHQDAPAPSSEKLAALAILNAPQATPVGNWLEFVFIKSQVVTKVNIANGFRDKRRFGLHARLKTLTLECDNGFNLVVNLADVSKVKTYSIPAVKTRKIRIVPGEIYAGTEPGPPYLSYVQFFGYNPDEKQVVLTGEFKDCKMDPAHSEDQFHCGYLLAADGTRYGCADDLCYHPKSQVGSPMVITGVVGQDNILTVLEARPAP